MNKSNIRWTAVSLWQPWATLVALGIKKIETRHWKTAFRGGLLIHATKLPKLTKAQEKEYSWLLETNGYPAHLLHDLPYGCIVAVCDMTDCLRMAPIGSFTQGAGEICIDHQSDLEKKLGDWRPGRYAWILDDVVRLEPFPIKGMQGFWVVPDDVVKNVVEQLNAEVINGHAKKA